MKPKEIDSQHELGSDLHLKVTPISRALIQQYDFKKQVTTFIDNIEHTLWYDIPSENNDWWESKGMYCGETDCKKKNKNNYNGERKSFPERKKI